MARNEADREDLFAEAVTLVRRWEGTMPACSVPLLVGFKDRGDVSFYFGPDQVYHCDGDGRFRRAYVHGYLYRSQGDRLVRMRRHRTESETALLRTDLTQAETAAFRTDMVAALNQLREAWGTRTVTTLRQFPADDGRMDADILSAIETILAADPWLAPVFVQR